MRNLLIAEEFQNAVPNATYGTTSNTKIAFQIMNTTTGLPENIYGAGPVALAQFQAGGGQNAMIRWAQGKGAASDPDVFTPWVRAGNLLSYDGMQYEAETASFREIDIDGDASAQGEVEFKFVLENPQDGVDQFWSFTYKTASATTSDDDQATAIKVLYDSLHKPEWLFHKCAINGNTLGTDCPPAANGGAIPGNTDEVAFYGNIPGATTTSSGKTWDGDSAQIKVIIVSNTIGTTAYSILSSGTADNGVGTYYSVNKYEEKMMGKNYGYYNRRSLPNTPASTANSASTYNLVNMVFSKDGSTNGTVGAIKGVDNLIEITIAGKVGGSSLWAAVNPTNSLLNLLNYFATMGNFAGNTYGSLVLV